MSVRIDNQVEGVMIVVAQKSAFSLLRKHILQNSIPTKILA